MNYGGKILNTNATIEELVSQLLFSFVPGKLYAKRAQEPGSDRLELLRTAEPIDYNPEMSDPFHEETNSSWEPSGGRYQASRPTNNRFGSTRPNIPPPRNIFDDI